jgi:DNA-binding transcriptional regulator YhcF (GntR family)
MTVKCLDQNQKDFIAAGYRERVFTTDELALMHGVSKRTVQRILVEMGVNRIRFYRGRKAKIATPATEALQIDMFEPAPRSIKDIVIDFIAKTIQHFKK